MMIIMVLVRGDDGDGGDGDGGDGVGDGGGGAMQCYVLA